MNGVILEIFDDLAGSVFSRALIIIGGGLKGTLISADKDAGLRGLANPGVSGCQLIRVRSSSPLRIASILSRSRPKYR